MCKQVLCNVSFEKVVLWKGDRVGGFYLLINNSGYYVKFDASFDMQSNMCKIVV